MPIHYPPGGLDDSLRRSALGDIPGLRLPKRVILSKGVASSAVSLGTSAARLTLCLKNQVLGIDIFLGANPAKHAGPCASMTDK